MRKINMQRTMKKMGNDLIICIENEEGSHIGSCVSAQPYRKDGEIHVTLSTWNRLSHKDDMLAEMYAKAAAKTIESVVCCVCGVHIDDITEEELHEIIVWCNKDIEKMKKELEAMK